MTAPDDDRRLADLMSDAVSDVEPTNRLDAIRARTRTGEVTSMSSRRPWLYAVGGAVATAAVITAIAAASGNLPVVSADDEPAPAGDPSPSVSQDAEPSEEPTPTQEESDAPAAAAQTVAVYFVGDTPAGPRLYREFQRDESGADPLAYAVEATIAGSAVDPDYRTLWPQGVTVQSTGSNANGIVVNLAGVPTALPNGLSEQDAALALQQVVYSAQAALGQGRVGVEVMLDGQPAAQLLGQSTSGALTNAPMLDTLSHANLSTPAEGQTVSGDTLEVEGVANSFEANVIVRLERAGGGVVAEEPMTADGYMGNKLFPFSGTIDVSGLPAGEYVLTATTDDPSGGAEGPGAYSDTRTITIK